MKQVSSLLFLLFVISCTTPDKKYSTWKIKGGNAEGIQYSGLNEINKENVNQLQVAWRYQPHDADTIANRTQIQCNPIIVDNVLYGTTASLHAFAIDAATGKELWRFNPGD